MKEVPVDKFTGVLLGTKCDLEQQREISFFEGISLQEKYNLTFFMETNSADKPLKERLVQVMQEREEGLSESSNKKLLSIISVD